MLNPDSPIPLYRQLADELEECIRSKKLAVGARIASEHELARLHRIGRPTVRQATDYLVRHGLLERRRGSGTFVSPPRACVDLFTLAGTISAFAGAGLDLQTSLVESVQMHRRAGDDAGPLAGRAVFGFARRGNVDAHPVLLERMFLDAEIFPRLDAHRIDTEPLSRLVQRVYHRQPTHGQQTIRVCSLEAREAKLLKVESGIGALLVERTLDFGAVKAALFARLYILTDRVALTQSLGDPNATRSALVEREKKR